MKKLIVIILGLLAVINCQAQRIPKEDAKQIKSALWLSEYHFGQEDYAEVAKYSKYVVDIYEGKNYPIDKTYAFAGVYWGVALSMTGDYQSGVSVLTYINNNPQLCSLFNPKILLLDYLGLTEGHTNLGNYDEALLYCRKTDSVWTRNFKTNQTMNYVIQNQYGLIHSNQGDYSKALQYFEKALSITKTIKRGQAFQALVLSNIGYVHFQLGDLPKSLDIMLESKQMYDKYQVGGPKKYCLCLNLGNAYMGVGNLEKALEQYDEAYDIAEQTFGENSILCANVLNDIGLLCIHARNYPIAEQTLRDAVRIYEQNGDTIAYIAMVYDNLALVLGCQSKVDSALVFSEKACDIQRRYLPENTPYYWRPVLANCWYRLCLGDRSTLGDFSNVLDSIVHYFGRLYPLSIEALGYISKYYMRFPDLVPNKGLCDTLVYRNMEFVQHNLEQYTQDERDYFWGSINSVFNTLELVWNSRHYPSDDKALYDFALFSKGLRLNMDYVFESSVAENPKLSAAFSKLSAVKKQIAGQEASPLVGHTIPLPLLYQRRDSLEHALLRLVGGKDSYAKRIDWMDVWKSLGNNDVAVEFVNFLKVDTTMRFAMQHTYSALVLRGDWDSPKYIELFDDSDIADIANLPSTQIYLGDNNDNLRDKVWAKVLVHCNQGDNIYFSPSGILHRLSVENLLDGDGKLLGESYNFHRLSSTRQLLNFSSVIQPGGIAIFGAVDYDEALAQTDSIRAGFQPLPGTKNEIENISSLFSESNSPSKFFSGKLATEEAFKSLPASDIIHIATHGFFLKDERQIQENLFLSQLDTVAVRDNTLLRSGLILAGGNKAWQGKPLGVNNIDDGILTAQEIKDLDLSKTQMVVLSACETGLGEVNTDGVFGLQRAFKSAGVQTIVMSLWKVSDNATSLLMTEFYRNLLACKDRHKAFRMAKDAVRNKYPEPYYWAGWVMLD